MRITKLLASAAVPALIVVGSALAPTSAEAAATCVLGTPTVTPSTTISIGTAGVLERTVRVTATNCSASAAKALQMRWVLEAPGDVGEQGWPKLKPTNVGDTATFSGTLKLGIGNGIAGDRPTALWGSTKKLKTAPTLHIHRASRGDLDVWWRGSAKPPKGYWLYVNAYLERANWDNGKYGDYNKPVSMQFKPNGGSYKTIPINSSKDTTGPSNGVFWVKATVDGCYRFIWKGNSTTGAFTSNGRCIDLK